MLTIGKLAATADVTTDALRFYERQGLLSPTSKSEGGYRLYDQGAEARLRFIQHAQDCGFTLAEIRELFTLRSRDSACCGDVRGKVVEKKLQLEARIKAMKTMSKALDVLIAECTRGAEPVSTCPILEALERVTDGGRR